MKVFKQTDRQAGIKSERQTDVPRRAFVSCRIGADTAYRNNREAVQKPFHNSHCKM